MVGADMNQAPASIGRAVAPPMRILLSAYACEPDKGSEPGVGWHWARALADAGHDVCVITRANNRRSLESALAADPVPRLRFAYYELPRWAAWWKRGSRGVRIYYMLWQWGAYRVARALNREARFDIAHHITFGVFRHPSFMAFLDMPFVFGPVGGGESAPRSLRTTFPLRGYLTDLARDAANSLVRFDPLLRAMLGRSAAVLCKTHETMACIPERHRGKCRVYVEVGTEGAAPLPPPRVRDDEPFRILYVGRLVYWKGLHLGLRAFAQLRDPGRRAQLTVIGSGPEEPWLRAIAREAGIDEAVSWIPWLERGEVLRAYPRHDAFLFPSLHDSSGNAVLEALACGLPVVCVDTGGPGLLVDSSCGFKVRASSADQTAADLARALSTLARDPALATAMGQAAARRARENFSWARHANQVTNLYQSLCQNSSRRRAPAPLAVGGDLP